MRHLNLVFLMSILNAQWRPRISVLKKAGYERYEVSAFAKTGKTCQHNQNWNFGDYYGIGPGAHGKLTKFEESGLRIFRTKKLKQPASYIKNPTHTFMKEVSNSEYIPEFLMNALRLQDGVDWSTFEEKTGLSLKTYEVNGKNLLIRAWWNWTV